MSSWTSDRAVTALPSPAHTDYCGRGFAVRCSVAPELELVLVLCVPLPLLPEVDPLVGRDQESAERGTAWVDGPSSPLA